jgi:hypothetical protein
MLKLVFIDFKVIHERKRILYLWLLKRFEAFKLRVDLWLDQSRDVFWPLDVFKLIIVDEVKIIKFTVM